LTASPTNIRVSGFAAVDVIHVTLIIVGLRPGTFVPIFLLHIAAIDVIGVVVGLRSNTFVLILVFYITAVDLAKSGAREPQGQKERDQ
jgi:hypothetical protein